tara:strand:+ start:3553 stop:4020 length:468 start_codon:yes stop_codon:yes gene_type:complete
MNLKYILSALLLLFPIEAYNHNMIILNNSHISFTNNYTLYNHNLGYNDYSEYNNNTVLYNKHNGSVCDICLDIVSIIKYELNESNKTINDTERLVKALCKLLGNNKTKTECYDIVNDINIIKNMILKGLNPGDICQRIGFCSGFLFLLLAKIYVQ